MAALDDFRRQWLQEVQRRQGSAEPAAAAAAAAAAGAAAVQPATAAHATQLNDAPYSATASSKRPKRQSDYAPAPANPLVQDFLQDLADVDDEPHFDHLPTEVVELVFRYLPYATLCRCACVCREWNRLAQADTLWFAIARQEQLISADTPLAANRDAWRRFVRDGLMARDVRKRRWKELQATFTQYQQRDEDLQDETFSPLSSVALSDAGVAAVGYSYGHPPRLFGKGCPPHGRVFGNWAAPGLMRGPTVDIGLALPAHPAGRGGARQHPAVVVTADTQGRINFFDVQGGTCIGTINLEDDWEDQSPSGVLVAEDGSAAAVSGGTSLTWFVHEPEAKQQEQQQQLQQQHYQAQPPPNLDGGWSQAWRTVLDGHVGRMVQTSSQHLAVMVGGSTVDLLDVTRNGERALQLHGPLVGMGQERCFSLTHRCGLLAYGASSPVRHGIKVHEAQTYRLQCSLDHHGRPAEVVYIASPQEVAAGGRRTGVQVYDLRSEEVAVHLKHNSYDIRCLQVDGWRVVAGVRDLDTRSNLLVLWDRRAELPLWHIRCSSEITHLRFTDEWLMYASCVNFGQMALPVGELNMLDFTAPVSELADAECPFSSLYENLHGYRYDIVLETLYDNITPYKLG